MRAVPLLSALRRAQRTIRPTNAPVNANVTREPYFFGDRNDDTHSVTSQHDKDIGPSFFDERGHPIALPDTPDALGVNRIFPPEPPPRQFRLGMLDGRFARKHAAFVDAIRCRITAGAGGDGAIAFFPTRMLALGPPSGGSGGRGGSVFVEGWSGAKTLRGLRTTHAATSGAAGARNQMTGMRGEDVVLRVPLGTVVRVRDVVARSNIPPGRTLPSDCTEDERVDFLSRFLRFKDEPRALSPERVEFLVRRVLDTEATLLRAANEEARPTEFDITENGQRVLLAAGGAGGLGNPYFHVHGQAALCAGRGLPGDQVVVEFEMQTLADAGLVGLPNAGKSTFVRAISNATPTVAPYAFTTLTPNLGTLQFDDCTAITVADIPGIVRGAHLNKGLGHSFLRHIVRSKVLVFIVDVCGPDPCADLDILREELDCYRSGLSSRRAVVVANKADRDPVLSRGNFTTLQEHVARTMPQAIVVPASARLGKNVGTVCDAIRRAVEDARNDDTSDDDATHSNLSVDDSPSVGRAIRQEKSARVVSAVSPEPMERLSAAAPPPRAALPRTNNNVTSA